MSEDLGISAHWVNSEKRRSAEEIGLTFPQQYDDFIHDLADLVRERNPEVSRKEAIIRAVLIAHTRGDAGLSRTRIDSVAACLLHALEEE